MKRTKKEAEQTKEAILKIAFREFLKNGIDETTIDSIAKESGNTRGAVYWHFKDKNDIYDQLIEQKDIESISVFSKIVNSSIPPLAKIEEIIMLNFPNLVKKNEIKNFIKIKMELYIYRAKNGDKRNIGRQVTAAIRDFLNEAKGKGQLKKGVDPYISAKTILSLIQGIYISQNIYDEIPENIEDLKEPVIHYLYSLIK